jgi:type I restriction enzyme R subunit
MVPNDCDNAGIVSEKATRKKLVDPRLKTAGWEVVPYDAARPLSDFDRCAIEEYPTAHGPADYALCVDGRILGIVEAKKLALGPQAVLTQAERYSKGVTGSPLNFRGFRVPFLYSTNGELIWHHDVREARNRPRRVAGFHTPDALTDAMNRDLDAACQGLNDTPNDHPWLRPYQRDANDAIELAIADRKREMLVAMATGTGKTFTMVNQVYRLMKAGVARRVLFLVDRRALAAQAVRAFASFEPEPGLKFNQVYEVYSQRFQREDFDDDGKFDPTVLPASYLTDPQPGHAFVYVCTIQRMTMNLFGREAVLGVGDETPDEDADALDIPIHAFDLVIADECHRGYTSQEVQLRRQTLDHFDATRIGLTATPAHHTTAYFSNVVYRYEYDRAVREGYLVDYDVVAVRSNVRMNGVFLRPGEQVGVVDTHTGAQQLDLLEDERQFQGADVEDKVTSPDANRKILEALKEFAEAHRERYGRFPKTLIFAANDIPHTSHADQLVELAGQVYSDQDSDFVCKITGRVDRPLQRIREFRNRAKPGIAVTVDLLSTGVDIPDLECIVLLRPLKSRILFEQILGRGTRRGERFPDKSHFTVFDCFDGTILEYFRNATAISEGPLGGVARSNAEIIEAIWRNQERDYNVRCLVRRLNRVAKEMSGDAFALFKAHIPDGDVAGFAKGLPDRIRTDFQATMAILRNPDFQKLLLDYPRPPRAFVIAYPVEDEVSTRWMIRDGAGAEYLPEDYLAAFARFVKDHASDIDAIAILLDRPRDWGIDALRQLRDQLAGTKERFTPDNLRRAHEAQYHKALVDIISMVKHAARADSPLLTAEERVERAIIQVTADRIFTPEQWQWLERIRGHLVENLSVAPSDFDAVPVFERHGGWNRADRAFDGALGDLLKSFNEAIAA